jgi:hypothetical protein
MYGDKYRLVFCPEYSKTINTDWYSVLNKVWRYINSMKWLQRKLVNRYCVYCPLEMRLPPLHGKPDDVFDVVFEKTRVIYEPIFP